jgi:hypothetical protein
MAHVCFPIIKSLIWAKVRYTNTFLIFEIVCQKITGFHVGWLSMKMGSHASKICTSMQAAVVHCVHRPSPYCNARTMCIRVDNARFRCSTV